ncbi:MAG TPA: hypothetical protein H9754_05780 [Candidatus Anaerostipes avistercoris]|uniref:Uncharacterized protein n=1 Tax=Candidatus Anaerostipes avistercoris TaxID=2838462 RepID=A0A9D2PHK5_9FIRM|nr:hypothetical protein [Candidatus Anaerostipes avistercoris]
MLEHSDNRQAIHSLDALSGALFDLMQEDSFEKITITLFWSHGLPRTSKPRFMT